MFCSEGETDEQRDARRRELQAMLDRKAGGRRSGHVSANASDDDEEDDGARTPGGRRRRRRHGSSRSGSRKGSFLKGSGSFKVGKMKKSSLAKDGDESESASGNDDSFEDDDRMLHPTQVSRLSRLDFDHTKVIIIFEELCVCSTLLLLKTNRKQTNNLKESVDEIAERVAQSRARAMALLAKDTKIPDKVVAHDRTNEQIRITVLYVTGSGMTHQNSVCELAMKTETRTTQRAFYEGGWYETIVFGREPEGVSRSVRFEVKRASGAAATVAAAGSASSPASSPVTSPRSSGTRPGGFKKRESAMKTLRRLKKTVTDRTSASVRRLANVPPSSAVLTLDDAQVPYGAAHFRQISLRSTEGGDNVLDRKVVGDLCIIIERVEPQHVMRKEPVPIVRRVNENAAIVVPCRYAAHRRKLAPDARRKARKGGGRVPRHEKATEDDAKIDESMSYLTPVEEACRWPPHVRDAAKLLDDALRDAPTEPPHSAFDDRPRKPGQKPDKPPVNVEFHNSRYQTLLHIACEAKRADLVRKLLCLRPRPNPDLRDSFGMSPLHIAAALDDVDTIRVLLEIGDVAIENVSPFGGELPIHIAAQVCFAFFFLFSFFFLFLVALFRHPFAFFKLHCLIILSLFWLHCLNIVSLFFFAGIV